MTETRTGCVRASLRTTRAGCSSLAVVPLQPSSSPTQHCCGSGGGRGDDSEARWTTKPVLAGDYRIVYQCIRARSGSFRVTVSAPPQTADCANVGFTPNSDDLASDVAAYGLSCDEARKWSSARSLARSAPSTAPHAGKATASRA